LRVNSGYQAAQTMLKRESQEVRLRIQGTRRGGNQITKQGLRVKECRTCNGRSLIMGQETRQRIIIKFLDERKARAEELGRKENY